MNTDNPPAVDREKLECDVARDLERAGFFHWLLAQANSSLWAEKSPEQEVARVVTSVAIESGHLLDADDVRREARERVATAARRAVEATKHQVWNEAIDYCTRWGGTDFRVNNYNPYCSGGGTCHCHEPSSDTAVENDR